MIQGNEKQKKQKGLYPDEITLKFKLLCSFHRKSNLFLQI